MFRGGDGEILPRTIEGDSSRINSDCILANRMCTPSGRSGCNSPVWGVGCGFGVYYGKGSASVIYEAADAADEDRCWVASGVVTPVNFE